MGWHNWKVLEDVLQSDIMHLGVTCVVLIDLSGSVIAHLDTGKLEHDIYSLAALAAGNFGAVSAMANIIGENTKSLMSTAFQSAMPPEFTRKPPI
ncbi:MAG: roadblock/LC7 domain-containing protein [Desulfovermiculus sp.]